MESKIEAFLQHADIRDKIVEHQQKTTVSGGKMAEKVPINLKHRQLKSDPIAPEHPVPRTIPSHHPSGAIASRWFLQLLLLKSWLGFPYDDDHYDE